MIKTADEANRIEVDMTLHALGIELDRLEQQVTRLDTVDELLLSEYHTRISELMHRTQARAIN